MQSSTTSRARALSHKEYLDTLLQPTASQVQRITEIQLQRESEIDRKYHTAEEREAATTIQRAYRGHRERRQLDGLTLDPSSRWLELIKELKYRTATAPHDGRQTPDQGNRPRAASDLAKLNWWRAAQIAEHAGAGQRVSPELAPESIEPTARKRSGTETAAISMTMDLRYFLEMVDQKHRYGANLQVYHEEWLREQTDQNFLFWLDHGDGQFLDLPGCSRQRLDREQIRYLSKEERRDYLVEVDKDGKLRWEKTGELITTSVDQFQDSMHGIVQKGSEDPSVYNEEIKRQIAEDATFTNQLSEIYQYRDVLTDESENDMMRRPRSSSSMSSASSSVSLDKDVAHQKVTHDKSPRRRFHVSPATILNHLLRASIRPGTWIYVADTVGRLYVGIKSSGAFQHASFLSGARISSAGAIGIQEGRLVYLSPLSGHYRPTTKSFRVFVDSLKDQGTDLTDLKVSKAYAVLLGMEYYGKTKKEMNKVAHAGDMEKRLLSRTLKGRSVGGGDDQNRSSARPGGRRQTNDHEHRKGLAGLMDDLHVRRQSFDGKR